MATKKKLLQAAAGQAGGAALNVEDVFSTYLYEGNGSTQTITNDIDLDGEGGLVWFKRRDAVGNNTLTDTINNGRLITDSTNALNTNALVSSFNSDGFSLNTALTPNQSGSTYASWTFRKHPDFFNVVEYTGDGSNSRDLPHGLNKKPGFIVVKRTDSTGDWVCSHRSSTIGELNSTAAFTGSTTTGTPGENGYAILNAFSNDTTVRIAAGVGGLSNANANGASYVAYIWAHNDGDGTFGPDGDQDIIKCGSYTGDGSSSGVEVDLGFEPQWVLVKSATQTSTNWTITDTMRGWTVGNGQNYVYPHTSGAEVSTTTNLIDPLPNGFKVFGTGSNFNTSGQTYIYIAIRRGPMAVPEDADDVFDVDLWAGNNTNRDITTGFPVDMFFWTSRTKGLYANNYVASRLTGNKSMITNDTGAEFSLPSTGFLDSNGFASNTAMRLGSDDITNDTGEDHVGYSWHRAPNYFDAVAYTGTGAVRTVNHNLGVAPEMMWVKKRNSTGLWMVYHAAMGNTKYGVLNTTSQFSVASTFWNNTSPTESVFTLGTQANVNASGSTYIAYLFASLDGISKVGSYTGNGTSQTIDCGFSSGVRFVIIKNADSGSGEWYFFDSSRGIVSGNDPLLFLHDVYSAESATYDMIDPDSSGFIINRVSARDVNETGETYIFYAIA